MSSLEQLPVAIYTRLRRAALPELRPSEKGHSGKAMGQKLLL